MSPPSAAVAAVRPALGDVRLPTERHRARATVARLHVDLGFVDERGHGGPFAPGGPAGAAGPDARVRPR